MSQSSIAGVDVVAASSRRSFARHTHDQFGIGVIERGAQKSYSARGMVEAGAGDIITVNPGEVHDGMPIGDSGRSWRMLYFDPALVAAALHDISGGKTRIAEFHRPVLRDAATGARLRALFALGAGAAPQPATPLPEQLLLAVLASVACERTLRAAPRVPAAVLRARERIDDDPVAPLTLHELARESGLSRFQLLRGFSKATGMTPHAYLVQRRIDLARRMIAGGAALSEAAIASGFADQSYMTRIFVRKYGITPRVYGRALS
ncbi:MAG TPA: AraC family transcriptional regulator [Telluria sp.]|nr:AraC family transcriptional regulator [Telluria sp.]